MTLIEIVGVDRWRFSLLSAPDKGHATISVDGLATYDGRMGTGRGSLFEIADLQGRMISHCRFEPQSCWKTFLGHRNEVVRNVLGEELIRIKYSGAFGFRRTVLLDGQELPCPWGFPLVFPGAVITLEGSRVMRATIGAEQHRLAYLSLAFYLWSHGDAGLE